MSKTLNTRSRTGITEGQTQKPVTKRRMLKMDSVMIPSMTHSKVKLGNNETSRTEETVNKGKSETETPKSTENVEVRNAEKHVRFTDEPGAIENQSSTAEEVSAGETSRPFDNVTERILETIEKVPPVTGLRPKKDLDEKGPSFRIRNELFKAGREETLATRILDRTIELTIEELLAMSNPLKQVLARKMKSQRVQPKAVKSAFVNTQTTESDLVD